MANKYTITSKLANALTLTALIFPVAGCILDENWETDTHEIVNGYIDNGHPFVGMVYSGTTGPCTGTLIGPQTVLTAAHCMTDATAEFYIDAAVYTGQVRKHPSFNPNTLDYDVAVIRLNYPISSVSPAGLSLEAPKGGQLITLVGFGAINSNQDGIGTKRKGINSIDSVQQRTFTFSGATGTESATCYGDSGGPAFNYKNQICIIGITNKGPSSCSGSGSWHDTRVDVFNNWIRQNAAETLPASCDPTPPYCGDGICEGAERDYGCRVDCGFL